MNQKTPHLLEGHRLTTACILYYLPDHPSLIQTYLWQEFDLAPKFPQLAKFLDFWEAELEGKLHSVMVSSNELIQPTQVEYANKLVTLH